MFGVFADDPDHPFSFYDLTLVTDFFDGCPDFHYRYPVIQKLNSVFQLPPAYPHPQKGAIGINYFSRNIILPRERS
jgi:hypothetical protein